MKNHLRFPISDFRSPQASRAVPAPSPSSLPIENRKSKIENFSSAFSLVELLVTIAIIVILVGLTVVVGGRMRDSARTSHTRLTLHQAKAIADEYTIEANNDTVASFYWTPPIGTQWDWSSSTHLQELPTGTSVKSPIAGTDVIGSDADMKKYSGERFVWAAWQLDGCQKMVNALGPSVLVDKASASDPTDTANNFYELRDDWGNKIIYVPYSPWPPSPGASTPWPSSFLPDHPTPFFVSAGPDGDFGDVRSTATPAQNAAAKDNLYSYDSE